MRALIAAIILAIATPVAAEVVDAQADGFQVRHVTDIAAPPDKIYAALVNVSGWWSSTHSFSGSAANMTLDARPGGCFCEALPGGGVQHMTVVYAAPGKVLRLRGALGPFQGLGVDGALTFAIKPTATGSELTTTYTLGGYTPGGLVALASAADGMLGEQVARFKRYAETGAPQ